MSIDEPIRLCFRLLPTFEDSHGPIKQLPNIVFIGALETILPILGPGESFSHDIMFMLETTSKVRLIAHAEEIPKSNSEQLSAGSIEKWHWECKGLVLVGQN